MLGQTNIAQFDSEMKIEGLGIGTVKDLSQDVANFLKAKYAKSQEKFVQVDSTGEVANYAKKEALAEKNSQLLTSKNRESGG